MTAVARVGVDLSYQTPYGAEQFSSNVIENPGFEPTIDRAVIIVGTADVNGFGENAPYYARANGFWNGATFQVLTGTSAGATGTIAASLQAGPDGNPRFDTFGPAPALASGDAVSVTVTQNSGVPANWWVQGGSVGWVAIDTGDHRTGSPGTSCADLTLQAAGASTDIISFLDSTPNQEFLPINGPWQLSFWARASGGTPILTVSFSRLNGSPTFVNQAFVLSTNWSQATINFNASDTGPVGPLDLDFGATGTAGTVVKLDDVSLSRASDTGAWRNEMVSVLNTIKPGYLREWQSQLGDTEANGIASEYARQPQRWQVGVNSSGQTDQMYSYSLADFLALCAQVGAQPWIVAPTAFTDAEWTALGSYLAGAQSTYQFKDMVVEIGDENWNGVFRDGTIPDPTKLGLAANRGFGLLKAAAGAIPLHTEIGGQYVNVGVAQQAMAAAPKADGSGIAPYYLLSLDSTTPQATAISQMLNESDEPPLISSLRGAIPAGKSVDVYEVNSGTFSGTADEAQREPLVAGAVSGTALASRLLTGMLNGVNRNIVFNLAQNNAPTSNGSAALFGIVHDLTAANHFRPTGLALQMLNAALPGDLYPVTGGTGLTAAAFKTASGLSVPIASANANPVNVSLSLPAGYVLKGGSVLSASSPTVTNETSNQVTIGQLPVNGANFTVPAYGFVVAVASAPTATPIPSPVPSQSPSPAPTTTPSQSPSATPSQHHR